MKSAILNKALKFCIVPAGIGTLITTICLTNISKPLYKLDELNLEKDLPELEEPDLKPIYVEQGGQGDGSSKKGQGGTGDQDSSSDEQITGGDRATDGGDEDKKEQKSEDEEEGAEEEQESETEEGKPSTPKGDESGEQNVEEIISGGNDTLVEILKEAMQKISDIDIPAIPQKLYGLYTLSEQLQRALAAARGIEKNAKNAASET